MNTAQKFLLFTSFLLCPLSIFAQAPGVGSGCQMSKDYKFNFFISPENQVSGLYGALSDRIPPTVISNCQGASGKVLGFGLGLRQPYLSSDSFDVSFDGKLTEEICKIENAPTANAVTYAEKLAQFQEQFKLLRSCTYIELTHLDNKPILFSEVQNYCKLTQLPSGKVRAEGDFCYIKVRSDLRIAVSILLKPECLKSEFLLKSNLNPRDIEALLQAFVVDDESSISTDNMIGTTKVRLTLMPDSKTLSVNQDAELEGPLFPTTFSTDIHQGPIIIKDGSFGDDKKTFFDISLFIDTRSLRTCRSGVCVGPGDYQTPMAGEIEIYEILPSGKKLFLDSWFAGNPGDSFAKAQWQGLFRMGRKVSEGLEMLSGKTYELQFNFYNPYDDYIMLVKGYQQILVDLTLLNGTAGKDFIQPLNAINGLLGLPSIPSLPQLGSTEIEVQLEKVRMLLQKMSEDKFFPPFYTQVCNSQMSSCQKVNAASKYLTLNTRFTIQGTNPEDNSYLLTNIQTQRQSKVFPSYTKLVTELPKLVCQ